MTTSPRASEPQAMDEPPNAPDVCPACGARKRIDSGEFVHYVCGVCYWRMGQKVVSDLYDDHAAAVQLRARVRELEDELTAREVLIMAWEANDNKQRAQLAALTTERDATRPDEGKRVLLAELHNERNLNDSLRARAEQAEAKLLVTYCAYCGAEFPLSDDGSPDLVGEHIRSCEKHPMRELEADNAYLIHELNKAREKAATYERDWFDAKHEFGKTVSELRAELTAARARLAELQARDNASAMIRVVDAVLHLQECNNLRGPDPYCENCDGEGGAMLGGGCGDCWASDIYEAENNLSVAVAALPKDWRRIETQIVVADL